MQRFVNILAIVVALCLFRSNTVAQNLPTTCAESSSMNLNTDQLAQIEGIWYEVARSNLADVYSCVQVNITVSEDNTSMEIDTTFSESTSALWVNTTMSANITLSPNNNGAGYNFSSSDDGHSTPPAVYKLLATDFDSYALVCGYTNLTDNASSFGIVLTREQMPNSTYLNQVESDASAMYSNFQNGTMPLITQSESCYTAGAATGVPFLAGILSVIYIIMKIIN